jgi:protein-disulfide isomerase
VSKRAQRAKSADELKTSPWVIAGIVAIAVLVVAVLIQASIHPEKQATAPNLSVLQGIPLGVSDEGYPYLGNPDAKVLIVAFEDLRCPFCKAEFLETEPQVLEQYVKPGLVRIESRMIAILGSASVAAGEALRCAGEQGKYWQYRYTFFSNQPDESVLPGRDDFVQFAQLAGVPDIDQFTACYDAQKYRPAVDSTNAAAQRLGISSTPTFLVNGEMYEGKMPFLTTSTQRGFKDILDAALVTANSQ